MIRYLYACSLTRSGVYGPVTVGDDARLEADGRRSIATQTRTFPLEYEPARQMTEATTQTTSEIVPFDIVRCVADSLTNLKPHRRLNVIRHKLKDREK